MSRPRKAELVWSAVFLIHSSGWLLFGTLNIAALFGLQFVVTVVIIAREVRRPTYHGVLSRRLNPRIEDYLRGLI